MSEHEENVNEIGNLELKIEKNMEMYNKVKNNHRNTILIEKPNDLLSDQYSNTRSNIIETETKICKNNLDDTSKGLESINNEVISINTRSTNKEIINNQLIILEPSNPVMTRFQNTLKQHLLKQRTNIKQELLTLEGVIRSKLNKKSSFINEINSVTSRVENQHNLLNELHRMKTNLETAKDQVEMCINQGKLRCTEILSKTAIEKKKFLKRQIDRNQGLLIELSKYEKEQEITFNICNQKNFQTKLYKKKLLNEQQKQDLLLLCLTQEILRLEDRMKQLGEQAETKYNERELLKQKVMDNSIDLDAINEDNAKITLLWNDVLISIKQRDKSFQKIKNDYQESKNKYHVLLMEANSYKRSAQEEFHKNNDYQKILNKLNQDHNNKLNNSKIFVDKLNNLKDQYSKLTQIIEFQHQNLDQVLLDQKSIRNEINTLLYSLDKKSNKKLKYEEDILDELKKQLFANNHCVEMNNKILKLKIQNREHDLILVGVENNLSQALLKLEQYRITSSNLQNDVEENVKLTDIQKSALFTLDSKLKKLFTEIQNKSRQIDLENKQLEIIKKRHNEGYNVTPQMQINQVKYKIDEVEKEIDVIKQSWIEKQNKNVQLLDQRNKQFNELNKMRKYVLVMDTKNIKLEQEIISLTKKINQYKRMVINMNNTILKLNENFNQNKRKSSQLLNENEWIKCSYLAELKENEKQYLESMDQLKLLKNELNELKHVYLEKQRESKSWDSKVQSLLEIKKEMKKKEGDLGDIDTMKNEIHRMQIRESQLKKILEKIMLDLEVCISRREMIYNKVAAKDIRLKGKNETKQKFIKKLNNLRNNIKKVKIECKKLDKNICDLKHDKMELESKVAYLNGKLLQVHKNINDLIRNIEDIGVTKIKNIHNLSYKQNYSKFLEEVKKGKYRLSIKNESKMNEEFGIEWKKNSDLISVIEALKNDFPHLDFQISRLLNILKSIEN